MPNIVNILDDTFTTGWLLLLIISVALAAFARQRLRLWILPPLLAYPLGTIWYRLWLYHGWSGPPRFARSIIHADGEAAYDATFIEMVIILCAALYLLMRMLTNIRIRN